MFLIRGVRPAPSRLTPGNIYIRQYAQLEVLPLAPLDWLDKAKTSIERQ